MYRSRFVAPLALAVIAAACTFANGDEGKETGSYNAGSQKATVAKPRRKLFIGKGFRKATWKAPAPKNPLLNDDANQPTAGTADEALTSADFEPVTPTRGKIAPDTALPARETKVAERALQNTRPATVAEKVAQPKGSTVAKQESETTSGCPGCPNCQPSEANGACHCPQCLAQNDSPARRKRLARLLNRRQSRLREPTGRRRRWALVNGRIVPPGKVGSRRFAHASGTHQAGSAHQAGSGLVTLMDRPIASAHDVPEEIEFRSEETKPLVLNLASLRNDAVEQDATCDKAIPLLQQVSAVSAETSRRRFRGTERSQPRTGGLFGIWRSRD